MTTITTTAHLSSEEERVELRGSFGAKKYKFTEDKWAAL